MREDLTKYLLFISSQSYKWNKMSYIPHTVQELGYFSVSKNSGGYCHFTLLIETSGFPFPFSFWINLSKVLIILLMSLAVY